MRGARLAMRRAIVSAVSRNWSAGTTLRSGSLSVGWVAASAQPAPALWLWQRDGFVAQDVDWIPWALDALTDTPHRHDT